MKDAELKPCPFCGSADVVLSNWGLFRCWCTNCLAKTADTLSRKEAIQAWNRRVDDETRNRSNRLEV